MNYCFRSIPLLGSMVALLCLQGCANQRVGANRPIAPDTMQWGILSPDQWQQQLTTQQVLTIQAQGQVHQAQALLEISPQAVKLVVLKLGRRILTIQHTLEHTEVQKDPFVPNVLDAQRILQDIQLVYAPVSELQTILPKQCHIQLQKSDSSSGMGSSYAEQRFVYCANDPLSKQDQLVYQIRIEDDRGNRTNGVRVQLQQLQAPYSLEIDTVDD